MTTWAGPIGRRTPTRSTSVLVACAIVWASSVARADEVVTATPVQAEVVAPAPVAPAPIETSRAPLATFETSPIPQQAVARAEAEAPHITRLRGVAPRAGLMLGVGGAQQPVRADLVIRVHDLLAFGASVGGIPSGIGSAWLSAVGTRGSLSSLSVDGSVLLFPLRGSFFLGAAMGRMGLSGETTGAGPGSAVVVDAHATYLTPRAGWLATWESGFSLGFDVGAQVPLSTSVVTTGNSPKAANVDSLARALAGLPVPTFSLRLGWML